MLYSWLHMYGLWPTIYVHTQIRACATCYDGKEGHRVHVFFQYSSCTKEGEPSSMASNQFLLPNQEIVVHSMTSLAKGLGGGCGH